MSLLENLIDSASSATGISKVDLTYVFGKGERKEFAPGEYLFHESSPRLWAGIVEKGEVDIVRGLHGSTTHLSTLAMGAMIGEGALLDESPHSASAVTRTGATIWVVLRADWESVKKNDPEIFYRIVARVAQRQAERLRYAADQLAGKAGPDALITAVRREHDLLGDRDVPLSAYYGVQTLRGVENFPISGLPLKNFAHFVNALAMVKKGAAQANGELGVLTKEKMAAICSACDEILAGKLHDQFVVDMIQGGAGTSTNMNANEVIANRALELLGYSKGEYKNLHPNDDVNCSQSTNDAYPTAIKLGVYFSLQDTLGALGELKAALEVKEKEFAHVLKMGRTENQDAVPMTLGQEFGAYAAMIDSAM
jgi:aspartate ammonia-lyase